MKDFVKENYWPLVLVFMIAGIPVWILFGLLNLLLILFILITIVLNIYIATNFAIQ